MIGARREQWIYGIFSATLLLAGTVAAIGIPSLLSELDILDNIEPVEARFLLYVASVTPGAWLLYNGVEYAKAAANAGRTAKRFE
jgi:hypothetical protein